MVQVKKLDSASRRIEELTKAYSILTTKVASLRESVDKAKANVVKEFKDLQSFFDLLGSQYSEGFKDFKKDDEVVDIEDGDEDMSEKAIAPR
nr:hypothetical protein CFP56_05992 [Quercus suber]